MKLLILSALLLVPLVAKAQTLTDDTPAPTPAPDTRSDGVIWEEEYIPQTPSAPPDGPTKLAPRSVRIQAEVLTLQTAAPTDDAIAARCQIKLGFPAGL